VNHLTTAFWTPIRIALCVTYAAAIVTLIFVI
jgi:hypothetical protein